MDQSLNARNHTTTKPLPRQLSHSSSFYLYCHRRKNRILYGLATLIIAVMAVGIVYTAHYYYHIWGGQGFLKPRDSASDDSRPLSYAHLPLRSVAARHRDPTISGVLGMDRTVKNIPFNACGDQLNDCLAFDQPVRIQSYLFLPSFI
jgi:hypothetical protein